MKHIYALLVGIIVCTCGLAAVAAIYLAFYKGILFLSDTVNTFGFLRIFAVLLMSVVIYLFGRYLLKEYEEFQSKRTDV